MNFLSYGIRISEELSFVLSQFTRVTDRRTDARTALRSRRPRLHIMQRGKNQTPFLIITSHCFFSQGKLNKIDGDMGINVSAVFVHIWKMLFVTLTFTSMTLQMWSVHGPAIGNIWVSFGSNPFSGLGAVASTTFLWSSLADLDFWPSDFLNVINVTWFIQGKHKKYPPLRLVT